MRIAISEIDKYEDAPQKTPMRDRLRECDRWYRRGARTMRDYAQQLLKTSHGKSRKYIFNKIKENAKYLPSNWDSDINTVIDSLVHTKCADGLYSEKGYWYADNKTLAELKESTKRRYGRTKYYFNDQDVLVKISHKPAAKKQRYASLKPKVVENMQIASAVKHAVKSRRSNWSENISVFMGYKYRSVEVSKRKVVKVQIPSKNGNYIINKYVHETHWKTEKYPNYVYVSAHEYAKLLDDPKFDHIQNLERQRANSIAYQISRKKYKRISNLTYKALQKEYAA